MPSGASSASVGIGRASSGRGPSPPRQRAHAATVGQLVRVAAEPTTRPKCPAGSATSYSSARDAARRIARTLGAGAISSTSPTKARIGRSMSASVTSRSSTMKPPSSIRLWATNWRMKSVSAGPGQATQPSASRKRRWRSRGSSASRSCRASTKASCWRSDFTGSRSRKPARLAQAGSHRRVKAPVATSSATPTASCSGTPNGMAARVSTGAPKVTSESMPSPRR